MITRYFTNLLLLLFIAGSAEAQPYKWINEQGQTCYGEFPPTNRLYEQFRFQPPPPPDPFYLQRLEQGRAFFEQRERGYPAGSLGAEERVYDSIRIVSPRHDEEIRTNNGNFPVTVDLQPGLDIRRGHRVALFLDDRLVAEPGPGTTFQLRNISRGSHTLVATVLSAESQALASSMPVMVHVKRQSLLGPGPRLPAPNWPSPIYPHR